MKLPLFDANGSVGLMSSAQADYPHVTDLVAQMDRLGVSRSLVWHAAARDHHANSGNRQLLTAIADDPRLIPAFAIGMDLLWARRGLEELTAAMASHRGRAVRLFPTSMMYTVEQIEPVIGAIAHFQPVLLCSVRELRDPAELAQRFPRLPLVFTHTMWPHLAMVMDLMRRYPNVYADISWMHATDGTIQLLCRHFGAERVIFGLGGLAHQGASIAALLYANISETERALIAHGNLDRLLGLPATPARPATITQPLWHRFINREPLGLDVLDAHSHLGPASRHVMENQELADQLPQALCDMDQCQIKTMTVAGFDALCTGDPVAGNDLIATALRQYGDRFRGWIVFNAHHAERLTPHLERWLANPFFVGFKLHNDIWRLPPTDPRFEIVWQTAHAHHLPILLHTWDTPYSSPALLRKICPQYPNAMFIFGHAGGGDPGRREAEEMVATNSNVWLEWCGSFCSTIRWEETLPKIGKDRLIFGTDATVHSFAWELGRLLSLDLPEEMIRPALGDNFRGLLARRLNRETP